MSDAVVKAAQAAVQAGTPDTAAFLALLRHYQSHPGEIKTATVCGVLLTCLADFTSSSFVACLCLVPEKYMERDEVKAVCALDDKLRRGEFAEFWASLEAATAAAKVAPGTNWAANVRKTVAAVVRDTFQSVDAKYVAAACNIKDAAALKDLLPAAAFKVEGALVSFAKNEFNTPPEAPKPKEITSAHIARLVKVA